MNILCLGKCCYEITCPLDNGFVEGMTYTINDKVESLGGIGATVAYMLGLWGTSPILSSVLGDDDYGHFIRKELSQAGVKDENIETSFDSPTSLIVNMVNLKNKQSTLMDLTGSYNSIKKEDWKTSPDIIFTDGYYFHASTTVVDRYSNAILVVDANNYSAEINQLCKVAKYIVCSLNFATELTGLKVNFQDANSLVSLYNAVLEKYPRTNILIYMGDKGVLYSINDQIKMMQGLKEEIVDVTGMNEAFKAALIYGLSVNNDYEKVLQMANIAAGLTAKKIGGIVAMPNLSEVINIYNEKNSTVQPPNPNVHVDTSNTIVNNNNNNIQASQSLKQNNALDNNSNETINGQANNMESLDSIGVTSNDNVVNQNNVQ
jgi:ribokinase